MKTTKLALIILIITTLLNCSNEKIFIINGQISGIPDSTLIKLYDVENEEMIDSCYTVNQKFTLEGFVDYPRTCWIYCNNEVIPISVENIIMTLESNWNNMDSAVIKGGREQELANEVKKMRAPYEKAFKGVLDSLMNKKFKNDSVKNVLIKRFNELQDLSHNVYVNYAKKNSNSYYGICALYLNRNNIPLDTLKNIYSNLNPEFKDTKYAQILEKFIFEPKIEKGKPFIDFTANTIDGDRFQLSSIKGKYIFINFWSSGCGYCRKENKLLSSNFNKLHEDLTLVSFSLDKKKENWLKASKADSIFWNNISDLQGGIGMIKTQYDVQAIPVSYLIDKNGVVIEKMLGYDEELIDKINKLIEENKNAR